MRKGSSAWKAAILEWLMAHPGNLSGAAKEFGTTRAEIEKLLTRNPKDAENLKQSTLDRIEELVYLAAMGEASVPKTFNMGHALRLLKEKRPKEWGGKFKEDDTPGFGPQTEEEEEKVQAQWVANEYGTFLERRPEPITTTTIRVENPPGTMFAPNDAVRPYRVHPGTPSSGNGLPRDPDPDI